MRFASDIEEQVVPDVERRVTRDRRNPQIQRFEFHQRAQHFIMMASVLLLVFTGMPQKFTTWPGSEWLIAFWGGVDRARFIHRIAGFAMLFSGAYHLAWLAALVFIKKQPLPTSMLPTLQDFRDFFQMLGYYVGLARERPRFDRYSYVEKFDYWAVFWGVPIMGGTGLILMFPLLATRWLPGVAMPIANIAHSDEALLAAAWLFVVHFYNAHLAPHIFPFNGSIFTGNVPVHRYAEEHPLEFERMSAGAPPPTTQP